MHWGLLNLDKPAGVTSRDVVNVVQRLARPAKVGHAGTLDPLATGVLVVCVGPATRLISLVQQGRKVYRARFRFGLASDTDDIEGNVTEQKNAPHIGRGALEAVLPEFLGTIEQVPPAHSAVHVNGRRAYELARRGVPVELAAKRVEVFRFDILTFDEAAQELECEIECGSGTYVRSLGRDLAKRLGSSAVMTGLRRTAVGPFRIDEAVAPERLTRESLATVLLPAASALARHPRVALDATQAAAVRHGRAVPAPRGALAGEVVGLFFEDRLIGVAHFDAGDAMLRPKIVFPEMDFGEATSPGSS